MPHAPKAALQHAMPVGRGVHWAATHWSHIPAVHFRIEQSASVAHARPGLQGMQSGPPQSTSVSVPSFVWFEQDAPTLHRLPPLAIWQTPSRQSASTLQGSKPEHLFGHEPPQSEAVSLPSGIWLVHDAGRHTPPTQLPLSHARCWLQPCPRAQRPQPVSVVPQSISVS